MLELHPKTLVAYGLLMSAAVLWVVLLGLHFRDERALCARGLQREHSRCCAPGQAEVDGACVGQPTSCPAHLTLTAAGCVGKLAPVDLAGGSLDMTLTDWDLGSREGSLLAWVEPFRLDPFEVNHARYAECVAAARCAPLPPDEPGRPVGGISASAAAEFCRFAGGRLPSESEWIFAASSGGRNRYPWGPSGLVCRRAVFGMVSGPCAEGATGPEIGGSRPDGATPSGVYDLAGNVAEWVQSPTGEFLALGGSFRSTSAASLKSYPGKGSSAKGAGDLGFRCAYGAGRRRGAT